MKIIYSPNKSLLINSLFASSLLICSTGVFAEDPKEMFCNLDSMAESFMFEGDTYIEQNPFIEVDYKATFKNLPTAQRKEAETLLAELDKIHSAYDNNDFGEVSVVASPSDDALFKKEDRLNEIICADGVKIVTLNLLDKLPKDKRKRAEQLWQEIQRSTADREMKLDELYSILDSVQV